MLPNCDLGVVDFQPEEFWICSEINDPIGERCRDVFTIVALCAM